MEALPFIVLGFMILVCSLYYIVKWAVKDALIEYFGEKKDGRR